MSDQQECQCRFGMSDWTKWQPSVFLRRTETRFCRRCGHRAYRPMPAAVE